MSHVRHNSVNKRFWLGNLKKNSFSSVSYFFAKIKSSTLFSNKKKTEAKPTFVYELRSNIGLPGTKGT